MKTMRPILTIAAVALMALGHSSGFAQTPERGSPPAGAKALFYGSSGATVPSTAPAPARQATSRRQDYMGVRYWIDLLEPSGQLRRVTTDYVFRAGDRIRLNVQSNREGYLSLLNLGSSGRATSLFPPPGQDGAVVASQVYQVPTTGFLRFDSTPGEETVVLLLSPTPLGGVTAPAAPAPGSATMPGAYPPAGAAPPPPAPGAYPPPPPGPAFPPAPPASAPTSDTAMPQPGGQQQVAAAPPSTSEEAARLLREAMAKGAKDLVVETEGSGSQPASYAVAPVSAGQRSGTVSLQIKLKHY
jgi:hypothetical protein